MSFSIQGWIGDPSGGPPNPPNPQSVLNGGSRVSRVLSKWGGSYQPSVASPGSTPDRALHSEIKGSCLLKEGHHAGCLGRVLVRKSLSLTKHTLRPNHQRIKSSNFLMRTKKGNLTSLKFSHWCSRYAKTDGYTTIYMYTDMYMHNMYKYMYA